MTKVMMGCIVFMLLLACNNEADNKEPGNDTLYSKTESTTGSDGWQILFDGQTLKGWHQYGGAPVGSAWKIADGAVYLDTATLRENSRVNGGDIVTDEEFENFDLKLEWKIAPAGNSGIIFYVNEDTVKFKHSYESGPEMQVVDNDGHPDGKIKKHQAGDLYDLISSSKAAVKPVGEWNEVEIKSVNGKLDFYLNGENVVSTMMWDDNWNTMIAASKFKEWPGFGTFKKGRICLQDHGNTVSFRNIRIKRL